MGIAALVRPIQDGLEAVERRILRTLADDGLDLGEGYVSLFAGGKRIRPALALLAAGPKHYMSEPVITLGAALEMLHTATLIHDDIVDGATMRRGEPTLAVLRGADTAILAGDHLFALGAVLATRAEHMDALRIFAQTLVTISGGELEELRGLGRLPSREEYLSLIHAKTACLFESAALGGSLIVGGDEDRVQCFARYGRNLGLAFQIADDVLDYVGDAASMGKPTLADMKRGVMTLPALLYAWDRGIAAGTAVPKMLDDEDVSRVLDEVIRGGYVQRALDLARDYAAEGWNAIEGLVSGSFAESLHGLSRFALERVE